MKDFVDDVMPYVEKNYRVQTDRANTAIAGLSMGGNHALQVGIPNLNRFAYIGVYSSGLLGGAFPGLGEEDAAVRRPRRQPHLLLLPARGPCSSGTGCAARPDRR